MIAVQAQHQEMGHARCTSKRQCAVDKTKSEKLRRKKANMKILYVLLPEKAEQVRRSDAWIAVLDRQHADADCQVTRPLVPQNTASAVLPSLRV